MRFSKIVIFLCFTISIIAYITTVQADQAIIETDRLNVRIGPGTHFDSIGQVNSDEVYEIIQIQGDWVEVEINDHSGWVAAEYITIERQADDTHVEKKPTDNKQMQKGHIPSTTLTSLTVQHDHTQIRKGPSVDEEIMMFAKKGQQFEVMSENEEWYEVTTDQGNGYVFKNLIDHAQSKKTNHIQDKTIVIDAGHGGQDVGAIGLNGTYEKSFTLKTATELATTLEMLGANVILTRQQDDYIRLASRPMLANVNHADAFLSIHYNSFTDITSVDGIDTYYYHEYDKDFANIIQDELIFATDDIDRGINYGDFQVLRQNHLPALLLELGFISNDKKEQLLSTRGYQQQLVKGINTGLNKFFAQ